MHMPAETSHGTGSNFQSGQQRAAAGRSPCNLTEPTNVRPLCRVSICEVSLLLCLFADCQLLKEVEQRSVTD